MAKGKIERGVLVGAPKLAAALEELGLIDEYRIVVRPVISGRGPTLFGGLSSARHLELPARTRSTQTLDADRVSIVEAALDVREATTSVLSWMFA